MEKHYELWEYNKTGEYIGAIPEKFFSYRAASDERKAMQPTPRLRAYLKIVKWENGAYYDTGTNERLTDGCLAIPAGTGPDGEMRYV